MSPKPAHAIHGMRNIQDPNNPAGRFTVGTCPSHGKKIYPSRQLARQAIRTLHDRAMREYRCDEFDGWHIGHLPTPVRLGTATRDEHYGITSVTSRAEETNVAETIPPLTFKPGPENIKPLNGHKPSPSVMAKVVDSSIEALLRSAEESDDVTAHRLAAQIRELVARLVAEVRISSQERDLRTQAELLQKQLEETLCKLNELKAERAPAPVPVTASWESVPQSAIRAWAKENNIPCPIRGTPPRELRQAYVEAMGA